MLLTIFYCVLSVSCQTVSSSDSPKVFGLKSRKSSTNSSLIHTHKAWINHPLPTYHISILSQLCFQLLSYIVIMTFVFISLTLIQNNKTHQMSKSKYFNENSILFEFHGLHIVFINDWIQNVPRIPNCQNHCMEL